VSSKDREIQEILSAILCHCFPHDFGFPEIFPPSNKEVFLSRQKPPPSPFPPSSSLLSFSQCALVFSFLLILFPLPFRSTKIAFSPGPGLPILDTPFFGVDHLRSPLPSLPPPVFSLFKANTLDPQYNFLSPPPSLKDTTPPRDPARLPLSRRLKKTLSPFVFFRWMTQFSEKRVSPFLLSFLLTPPTFSPSCVASFFFSQDEPPFFAADFFPR